MRDNNLINLPKLAKSNAQIKTNEPQKVLYFILSLICYIYVNTIPNEFVPLAPIIIL